MSVENNYHSKIIMHLIKQDKIARGISSCSEYQILIELVDTDDILQGGLQAHHLDDQ